jgi:rhamnosyltransferase
MQFSDTVDIVMGTYNGAKYLRDQVESLQRQTHSNWRLLVRDDVSSDGTVALLQQMAAQDRRITVVVDALGNLGFGRNYRQLLRLSTAPYTMFCDQDDVWLPRKIEAALVLAKEAERRSPGQAVLVHCEAKVVDDSLTVIQERFVGKRAASLGLPAIMFANCVQGAASLLNAKLRALCLELEPSLPHDFHAALIAETMGERIFIDESMLLYRQHGQNSIGADVPDGRVKPGEPPPRTDLLASLHHGLDAAPHIGRVLAFFEPRASARVKKRIQRYSYVLSGRSKAKRILLVMLENYKFSRRLDRLRYFAAIARGIV